ncbi:MAG: restriction endonuclease [Deltaproteobacteria bacterium]|nr:restriction endonuclease [Deltaproteobacteria bacterium]
MTFSEAAIEVLRLVGRPMHFKKITQVAIAKNLLSHVGKTPDVTMSARLAAVAGKDKADVPIVRTKAGVFALREWGDRPPNGPEVGENDSFGIPGEPEPEPRGKKTKPKAKEAKDEGKRKGKDGKEERRGRRGRKGPAEPREAEIAVEAARESTRVARPSQEEIDARPTEPEAAQPSGEGDGEGLAEGAEAHEETAELEADLDETAELSGQAGPEPDGQHPAARPSELAGPEGGGRRRRRRRRRRGGDRAEAGQSQGPIVEVRSRNGSGLPRVIPGGSTAVDVGAEERSDTTGSGSYPVLGAAAPAAAAPEPDEADLLGEVMAEREEGRERIQRPGPAPERRESPRREVVTRAEPAAPGEQSLADGAYRLLVGQERTGGVPIRQLAEQAQRAQLIGPDSPAPWMAIGAAMRSDNQRRALAGARPRFRALSGSRWALFEWGVGGEALRLETDATQIAEKQREASRKTLIRRLVDMGDPQFEHIALLLLDRLGYERPRRVPNRGGGRELHLAATNKIGPGGVVTALVFTRTGREIDAARVAELRGALHHYGASMGWILTTGSVAAAARDEAAAAGAPPVGLTDSVGLGRLFDETGVGLCRARVDLAFLDVELLDALKNG